MCTLRSLYSGRVHMTTGVRQVCSCNTTKCMHRLASCGAQQIDYILRIHARTTHIFMRYLLLMRSDFNFLFDRQHRGELSTALSICLPLVILDFCCDLGSVSLVVRFENTILEPQVLQFALQIIELSHVVFRCSPMKVATVVVLHPYNSRFCRYRTRAPMLLSSPTPHTHVPTT